jgi:glycosyltransferase involved in cell wall biosynthesis
MKVLLFANDAMPFGELPTSGGGLRCWQLYQGLRAHGIEVVASMPAFTYLVEKYYDAIPAEQQELLWNWATQDEIYRRVKPDAVIYASNWDHYGLSREPEVPLIIDLHGSRLIETTMWNNPVDTDRKAEIFAKADCLLCAGQRQRYYFYGWLLQAGRVPESEHFIRYIPVSLGPDQPARTPLLAADDSFPLIVSGGGWFPWQNQSRAIFSACREIAKRNKGRIEIFGTPHDAGSTSTEEEQIRAVYARVEQLSKESERVRVNGYISRNDLLGMYAKASVALEAMEYNLERELAFTTRTVEYLWCGLPVLYNNFGELSEHIAEYDAGWCVDPTSENEISRALEEIFDAPEILARKSQQAQRLVRDRFTWDKTIEPLVQFLRSPEKVKRVRPAQGPIAARASFLSPAGVTVDVVMNSSSPRVAQSVILPAEGISALDVPIVLGQETKTSGARLRLSIQTLRGRNLCAKEFSVTELDQSTTLSLPFPFWLRLQGGREIVVVLNLIGSTSAEITLRGLIEQRYPFTATRSELPKGRSYLDAEIPVTGIALRFRVHTGRFYRLCTYFERAVGMMQRGEWKRLTRAFKNRLPNVVGRLLPM